MNLINLLIPGEQTRNRFSQSSVPGRTRQDKTAQRAFFAFALVPVVLILVITIALVIRTWPFFSQFKVSQLLIGEVWRPNRGQFGFRPFILGTIWVTTVGVLIAVPVCLLTAIYLAEYAHSRTRAIAKPVLDLLAAIPPVVYGAWGLLSVVPFVDQTLAPFAQKWLGTAPIFQVTQPTGFGILAGGIVLAVMVTPLVISVIFEVLSTVPNGLRHASLGVGATKWQTICRVILPQVSPGIIAAIVLGTSRALGETIAVLMVVGNVPNIPVSVFDTAYPLPALIANNYGEMMSIPLYDSALLGAALVLLVVIVIFNLISTMVLQRVLKRR